MPVTIAKQWNFNLAFYPSLFSLKSIKFEPLYHKISRTRNGLRFEFSYDIITKEHNGSIKVDSREGEGSTFTINLPVA